jgi:S1-C subfamily serine protease
VPTPAGTSARLSEGTCPQCRETISGEASVCPYCRTSTIVDLVVDQPVSDARVRYQAARLVASLRPGTPLATIQAALSTRGGRVVASVTPGTAAAAEAQLHTLGVPVRQTVASLDVAAGSSWTSPGRLGLMGGGLAAVALAGGLFVWLRPAAPARPGAPGSAAAGPRLSGAQLARQGLAATVVIRCRESLGSGFFVGDNRVLTNAHVVCPRDETMSVHTADGRSGTATLVRSSEPLDLALVEVEGLTGTALPLGDAGTLQVGDPVVVVGAPKGMEFSVTQGGISNIDRVRLGVAYLQTDAAINPGNSGGPMLDAEGRAVGVVSLKRSDAEGIALVLPINYAFTGSDALLPRPGPASPGFQKLLARAEASDSSEAAKLTSTGQRPGLMAAAVADGRIAVTILWPSPFDPGHQRFSFTLWNRTDRLCSMESEVSSWLKVEGEDGKSVLSPQVKSWLERHGFSSDLYLASAAMDFSQCPLDRIRAGSPVDLELDGADEDAARIRL